MIFIQRKFEDDQYIELFGKGDVPKDLSEYIIIDYNTNAFCDIERILPVINELYIELIKKGTNKELLNVFSEITERLNNLAYFQLSDEEVKINGENSINILMDRFNSFKYKSLSEFDLNTNIEFIKPIKLSKEQLEEIRDKHSNRFASEFSFAKEYGTSYYYYPKYLEKFDKLNEQKKNGMEVYLSFILLRDISDRTICSIIKEGTDTKINEYKDVLNRIGKIELSMKRIENYPWVDYSKVGTHVEIVHIFNRLLNLLRYLLNSTSFRRNEYLIFDKIKVDNSLMDFEQEIEYTKNIFLYQMRE